MSVTNNHGCAAAAGAARAKNHAPPSTSASTSTGRRTTRLIPRPIASLYVTAGFHVIACVVEERPRTATIAAVPRQARDDMEARDDTDATIVNHCLALTCLVGFG